MKTLTIRHIPEAIMDIINAITAVLLDARTSAREHCVDPAVWTAYELRVRPYLDILEQGARRGRLNAAETDVLRGTMGSLIAYRTAAAAPVRGRRY